MKENQGNKTAPDHIDNIIRENCYKGIRDQDGWETLILTINMDYPEHATDIINRLK